MTLAEQLGLAVFRHRKTGRWMVASRELARATAHKHGTILKGVRAVAAEAGLADTIVWGEYDIPTPFRRTYPCCWIPREVLVLMRLHNMPGCRIVREIIAEYARLIDMHDAAQPSRLPVTPAPEPKPAPPWKVSWRITDAIDLLAQTDAPPDAIKALKAWNNDRRWFALRDAARSWADVGALYNTGRLP